MKTKSLLAKLSALLDKDRREQLEQIKSIKEVLKKLKKKERKLKERWRDETDDKEREEIETKLKIIYKQRQKGVQLLQDLRGK